MAKIAIIMGSISDWETMKEAGKILNDFGIEYDKKVVSAHRTPALMADFAAGAKSAGYKAIIAGAGGAAHLPGMVAAQTLVPVIGVPIQSRALSGVDSLYSIVQMPAGVPVASMAIGVAGAKNAALYATQLLANEDAQLYKSLEAFRNASAEQSIASTEELNK
ncbi:5-(carboxyamino)imidazole ribonucleotide mutase [Lactococcus termiticola]|uniref:N5-carboxyaminoimidazole ribonucleotide mutase n=1 Tax=Lactococcus termiticola TaxID=2169526 RepID=A0A2R5HGK9_9LACT|nr:5-(carboxyamino)imidazole ribonucleotide mutase [Lactococcus termiticola]GBG97122.1 phosphoribosylaminoimidazole carboxylase catalytic subunit [Lactococcus termiticola]